MEFNQSGKGFNGRGTKTNEVDMKSEIDQLKEQIRELRRLGDRLAGQLESMQQTFGFDEDAQKAIDDWEEVA